MEQKKAPCSARAPPSLPSRMGVEPCSSGLTGVGVGPAISGGADQAVGCGRSTCIQKAQGEPEWLRTPGQAGFRVVGAAPSSSHASLTPPCPKPTRAETGVHAAAETEI